MRAKGLVCRCTCGVFPACGALNSSRLQGGIAGDKPQMVRATLLHGDYLLPGCGCGCGAVVLKIDVCNLGPPTLLLHADRLSTSPDSLSLLQLWIRPLACSRTPASKGAAGQTASDVRGSSQDKDATAMPGPLR